MPPISPRKKVSAKIGWSLIVLFCLQCVLLGASDEVDDPGKLIFAGVYILLVILTLPLALSRGIRYGEPVIRWTVALMCLVLFSRLVGISSGIPAIDWLRDSVPILSFWWILLGPFAFSSRRHIWHAYIAIIAVVALLTLIVTDYLLMVRHFSSGGLDLVSYARATDSVVLFGTFLTLPMLELPRLSHRICFGLLGASFVSAVLLTGTRSHVAAILAGLAFYFWLTRRADRKISRAARRTVLVSLLLGITAFGLALREGLIDVQEVADRAGEVSSFDFGALTQRMDESIEAWNGFRSSPLVGQGLGYRMPIGLWSIAPSQDELFMIHDFYLYVLLKFGIVGMLIFFGFLASMLRTAVHTYRRATLPFDRALSAGIGALIVALLVESVTSPRFIDRSATALLSFMMACLLSLRREMAAAESIPLPARRIRLPQPTRGSTIPHAGRGLALRAQNQNPTTCGE